MYPYILFHFLYLPFYHFILMGLLMLVCVRYIHGLYWTVNWFDCWMTHPIRGIDGKCLLYNVNEQYLVSYTHARTTAFVEYMGASYYWKECIFDTMKWERGELGIILFCRNSLVLWFLIHMTQKIPFLDGASDTMRQKQENRKKKCCWYERICYIVYTFSPIYIVPTRR